MLQVPSLPAYQLPQPSYNAVKIDIHNPSVGGATCPMQPMAPQMPQYQQPVAPAPYYYNYPQTQLYDYQQAPYQPYYMPAYNQSITQPVQPVAQQVTQQAVQQAEQMAVQQPAQRAVECAPCPPCPTPASNITQAAAASASAAAVAPAPVAPQMVAPQQVNINQAPYSVTTQPPVDAVNPAVTIAEQPKVEVVAPEAKVAPQVDVNAFVARLASPDFEVQANAMEEMANMVKDEPQRAKELLDTKIINSLVDAMNVDSSKLPGPTQEQIAAREKLLSGQQVSEQEQALAVSITPMEQAERNKSYAMFTTAILDKLYGDEVLKLTGSRVPLTELPGAISMVDQLKDNPNPLVRSSAIDAMSYVQAPEYKKDLTTLFTIAQNDQDKGVQEAATAALEKLNQI